jgi:hypothetical protein
MPEMPRAHVGVVGAQRLRSKSSLSPARLGSLGVRGWQERNARMARDRGVRRAVLAQTDALAFRHVAVPSSNASRHLGVDFLERAVLWRASRAREFATAVETFSCAGRVVAVDAHKPVTPAPTSLLSTDPTSILRYGERR